MLTGRRRVRENNNMLIEEQLSHFFVLHLSNHSELRKVNFELTLFNNVVLKIEENK